MIVLGADDLDDLSARARGSPRRRVHRNLHTSYQDPCQQLLNAVEPDSYIRPHRHTLDPKSESLLAIRGRFGILTFDETGRIVSADILGSVQEGHAAIVRISPDRWHTAISLDEGAILLEVKAGPFNPAAAKEFAPWAPAEGDAASVVFLEQLKANL